MASDATPAVKRAISRIDALRSKVRDSRRQGRSIPHLTAFDFDIIQKGLELLRHSVNAQHLLDCTTLPTDDDTYERDGS